MGGACSTDGKDDNSFKSLVIKTEGNILLGRSSRGGEDTMETNLTETQCEGADWIKLARDRDRWPAGVNTTMNLRVP
jgi:hypothetical protein